MTILSYNEFMKLVIHTDGGARGNPGPAACAFVLEQIEAESVIHREICGKFLGVKTNNEAEYQAIAEALKWIKENQGNRGNWPARNASRSEAGGGNKGKIEEILFKSDSLLIVSQLSGKWKINDRELQTMVLEIKKLEREIGCVIRYQYIPREANREADREVNRVLDSHGLRADSYG
jgi:ribonuclease HI